MTYYQKKKKTNVTWRQLLIHIHFDLFRLFMHYNIHFFGERNKSRRTSLDSSLYIFSEMIPNNLCILPVIQQWIFWPTVSSCYLCLMGSKLQLNCIPITNWLSSYDTDLLNINPTISLSMQIKMLDPSIGNTFCCVNMTWNRSKSSQNTI